MAFFKAGQADKVWAAVCTATRAGGLGWGAKLSLKDRDHPAVMVFTADSKDNLELECVRGALKALLIEQGLDGQALNLRYKTDEATAKGLFSMNDVLGREPALISGGGGGVGGGGGSIYPADFAAVSMDRDVSTKCFYYNSKQGCSRGAACHYKHSPKDTTKL